MQIKGFQNILLNKNIILGLSEKCKISTRPSEYLGVIDVRRAKNAPQESTFLAPRDIMQTILDQAHDIILIVGMDSRILCANQAAVAAYGYSETEILSLTVNDLTSPESPPAAESQISSVHLRKNGECFPVEISTRRIQSAGENAVIYMLRDISPISSDKTALWQSEQKYYALNEELTAANEELTAANEELTAMNEELTATEETLRNQFDELSLKETEIRRQNLILSSFHSIALGLMNSKDLQEILNLIVTGATQLADTPHGFIYTYDASREIFRRTQGLGLYSGDIGREIPDDKGIVGVVRKTGQPVAINDYPGWRSHNPESVQFSSIQAVIQVPLKSDSQVIGTIGLAHCDAGKFFGPTELDVLSRFAAMASLALGNANLLESYRQELENHQQTEAALQKTQGDKQAIIDAIPDMMFVLDRNGVFLNYKASSDAFMVPPEIFMGKPVFAFFTPELALTIMSCLEKAFVTGTVQLFDYQIPRNGQTEYYEARIAVSGANEALAICRNVTERFLMEEQLKQLSLHDALTGCYNRAFFEEEMHRLEKARDSTAGLLICDVDGLKIINDSLGHAVGDMVLRKVAAILKDSFRSGDLIARIGGDEFAVLLSTNSSNAFDQGIIRIRNHVAENNTNNPLLPISLSIGFAVSQHSSLDMTSLFKKADDNMYREKLHQKNSSRNAIIQGLYKSLDERDFIADGHSDRMQGLLESFAGQLGLPKHKYADLRLFAHFHDIGKVGIPDNILFSRASLTEEEWAVMRQHCEIGHRIAMATPELSHIAGWIMRHQEWWNGGGYPIGLKGNGIPLECRMLAIVDAYDSMTHDRPYRKAMDYRNAVAELHRCAGTQFDPHLVDEFTKLLNGAAH